MALPTFTDIIDQAWFVEPLSGPTHPLNYLDRFPEEVYNKSPDSHLVRLMYSFLGPAGIGWLRKNLLDARLLMEDYGFELFNLEKFYGNPFRFGRILDEVFDEDPKGLLPRDEWDRIKARDERYRNRAIKYMQGARLGNSPLGMELVSESAIGYRANVTENYRHLFDSYSDDRLGLKYFGKTYLTSEFIVRPMAEVSRSETQTINITGNPTSGSFVLVFNGQATTDFAYTPHTSTTAVVTLPVATIPVTHTGSFASSGTITVGNQTVTYAGLTETSYTGCAGGVGSQPAGTIVSQDETVYDSIPWNAPASLIQAALVSLTSIEEDDVYVTHGPIPNHYVVQFGGGLSNQNVPQLTAIHALFGGSDPDVVITTETGGLDASSEIVTITPDEKHNLQVALDFIRPVPTIPSFNEGSGDRSRQDWQSAASSSEYNEVIRYVTGLNKVNWPPVDPTHWIEGGVEVEAPRVKDDRQHHYVGFHDIDGVRAYTDEALLDSDYEDAAAIVANYNSEHIGPFSPEIQQLIPFFRDQTSTSLIYTADRALAGYPEMLTVTTQAEDGTNFINGIYPDDYAQLRGVTPIHDGGDQFWASRERTSGSEFLEIDLGSVQAVNFMTFEAIQEPIDLAVAYDTLDQEPRRHFVDVTPESIASFENSLIFDPFERNPWHYFEYHFGDSLGGMIFTRIIRLEITRRADPFLLDPLTAVQTPWSVEIRNLRIGRNVVNA